MKKTMKINLGSKVSFVRYTKKMDVKIYLNEAVQLVVNDGEGVVTKYGYVPNNALHQVRFLFHVDAIGKQP